MDLMVLGPLEAVEDGHPLPLGGLKQRTVLALLIANRGRPVSTDALIDGVYGEDAPSGARRSVQTYVSNLRGQLGDVIRSTGSGYTLDSDMATIDAAKFERLVTQDDAGDPDETAKRLRSALAMWRGHPYADVDGFGAILSEVSRLDELRLVTVERRVDADLAAGRHTEVVGELDSLTNEYPFRETFRGQHMLALYRSGRQAEALRAFEKARSYLVEEMGLDPSPELRDLEQKILDQDPDLGYRPAPTIRRAALLVADIAEPPSLAGTDPEDRIRVVDQHAEALTEAIEAHEGHLFAQRGTAVYAWFDSVVGAVNAAEEAQWSLADVDDNRLRSRIAIDSGDVERLGTDGVHGPPVSRAAALLACARGGHVLLAPSAHAELTAGGGEWQILGLGTAPIDGVQHEVPVHLLHGGWPMAESSLRDTAIAPAPPGNGNSIPGYEWREKVGEGTFGVVHRAYQPSVGREVAIKRIRAELADHPAFIRRFEIEAQLVARLEHPHIVPLYDYWRDADGAFLVIRWMRGGSLGQRLRRGSLGAAETSKLLSQIGPALSAAHRRGVVHRDLRPENVLADEEGNWYLSDFGVAMVDPPTSGVEKDLSDLGDMLFACVGSSEDPVARVADGARAGRYSSVEALLADWDAASGASIATAKVERTEVRNPYRGLDAFTELDVDDFYGRDGLVGQLVAAVADRSLTAVVGPSGIGKSSVVRAGLIPAVRNGAIAGSESWLVTDMIPTAYPFEQLASAVERIGTRTPADLETRLRADSRGLLKATQRYLPQGTTLLLVIDQFEELFTMATDEDERGAFLDLLAATATDPHSSVRVLLTIRADFFDRPLRYASFGKLLRSGTVNASAPTPDELREIIVKPAAAVGVGFDSGLVDRIVSDVGDQPGTLPLLEFALTRLFEHRSMDMITSSDYERVGGVRAALGRRAEQTYGDFSDVERDVARQVFLRMINVGDGGRSTRRRTRFTELNRLGYSPAELQAVVDPFVEARLLTLDRDPITRGPTIEVAHEALLSEWPRLSEWVESQQEDLLLHSRLAVAVGDWESSERDEKYLLHGGRLEQHEVWTAQTELSLTTAEREFLEVSRAAEAERRAERRRGRRRVLAGFGAAAVVALVLAAAALVAKRTADGNAAAAESQRLLANATAVMDEDPQLALLLSLAGLSERTPDSAGLTVLRQAMATNRVIKTHTWADAGVRETAADISPDGLRVAVGANPAGHLVMVDAVSGEELWQYDVGADSLEIAPQFMNSGSQLLVNVAAGTPGDEAKLGVLGFHLLDASTGDLLDVFQVSECGAEISNFSDSDVVALFRVLSESHISQYGCAPSPTGEISFDLASLNTRNGAVDVILSGQPGVPIVFGAAISADGSTVALATEVDGVLVIDTTASELRSTLPINEAFTLALSPDGSAVAVGGSGGPTGQVTLIFDTATGERIATIDAHPGGTSDVSYRQDGTALATAGTDSAVRIWHSTDGSLLADVLAGSSAKSQVRFSEDGSRLVISGPGPEVHVASLSPADFAEIDAYSFCTDPNSFYQSYSLHIRDDNASIGIVCEGSLVGFVFETDTGAVLGESLPTSALGVPLAPDGESIASQESWFDGDDGPWFGSIKVKNVGTGVVATMDGLCDFNWRDLARTGCNDFPDTPFGLVNARADFSPNQAYLAAVEDWLEIGVIWDVASGQPVHFFDGSDFAFSSDSQSFLIARGNTLELRDLGSFEVIASRTLDGRDADLSNLEFTPDGAWVIGSPSHDEGTNDLLILDAATLEEAIRITAPHGGPIRDIALSSDGSMVATAGTDGYAAVWQVESGDPIMRIPVDIDGRVQVVGFVQNDSRLLAAPANGPLLVYSLDPGEILDVARTRVRRGFTETECATYFPSGGCPTLEEIRSRG